MAMILLRALPFVANVVSTRQVARVVIDRGATGYELSSWVPPLD